MFGSRLERLMFPLHAAPTRLGIEQGLRGAPHRGPGCYTADVVSEYISAANRYFTLRKRCIISMYFLLCIERYCVFVLSIAA